MSSRPVLHLAMGGTISFADDEHGAVPALSGADVADRVRPAGAVETVELGRGSSIGLGPDDLLALAARVRGADPARYRGVVVSHGTDALEESAYLVALTCPRGRLPVAFAGALRHAGAPGEDGPANLADALAVVGDPDAARLGPVVVMQGEVHAARFVGKRHGTGLGAFASALAGPLGHVVEGRPAVWLVPAYEDYLGVPGALPRVELVPMAVGSRGEALAAVLATGPAGVVIDGLGAGHVPPAVAPLVAEATARGIAVVVASRCGDGPTLDATYAIPGAELDLQARGACMAGALSAVKARLRLAVALGAGIAPAAAFPVR